MHPHRTVNRRTVLLSWSGVDLKLLTDIFVWHIEEIGIQFLAVNKKKLGRLLGKNLYEFFLYRKDEKLITWLQNPPLTAWGTQKTPAPE